jgi:hypothetical protein
MSHGDYSGDATVFSASIVGFKGQERLWAVETKQESVAEAIADLIEGADFKATRTDLIVAEIVSDLFGTGHFESDGLFPEYADLMDKFVASAKALIAGWKDHDEHLQERMKRLSDLDLD